MPQKASQLQRSPGLDSGVLRAEDAAARQEQHRCYLNSLLEPQRDRQTPFSNSLRRARSIAASNPLLTRSVRRCVVVEAAIALAASVLLAVGTGGTLGGWGVVAITLVWALVIERFLWLHIGGLRSEEGRAATAFGLPNILTSQRMLMVPCVVYLLADPLSLGRFGELAIWLLLAGGMTDVLDGVLARALGQRTIFGKYLDPLTDILVTTAAAVGVGLSGVVPWWLSGLVIFRYMGALIGFTLVFMRAGTFPYQPTWVGKLCTPGAQLLFFFTTLALVRPTFVIPSPIRWLLFGVVGAWVAFNTVFLALKVWSISKGAEAADCPH